ncbi:adenylate cyclase 10 [Anaerolineales bacterium]|nr:adenylate cyclase 10 [Anaerolineales bacterium]
MHQLVPEFIYEKYRAANIYGSFQGAAIFADLSGFSTMTDALSVHGTHGAEVLADMMRVVFEPLVNAVYEQGGFVIGYAGDAFNAVFPVERDVTETMRRCLAAAWAMQAHSKANPLVGTPYGDFHIRIKVGIGFGATTWQVFKSINGKRASYWFRGESLNGAVEGEELARAGEVVADPISYNLLREVVDAEPARDCFLIRNIRVDLPAPLSLSPPRPVGDLVEVFFGEEVTHLPIVGEFRQVVNLFVDIPANISDKALIKPFMETVYLLQEQYGGFFLRPDLGDKGFNLLMFWGAPTAHENDVDRALNFILELSARTGITLRAGISYRLAYAGFIGSSQREDYTAYGWGVNLAARMMERAGIGEYWLDGETARRAGKHFNLKTLGGQQFKGFKREQDIFVLVGRKNLVETAYKGQLVGRAQELESLSAFVEPLKRGQFAGVMVLKGEAGIGKSRLIHSFQYCEYFNDFPAHWAVCQTDEILRLPFNPFTDWLKKRFELIDGQPDDVNFIQFSRILNQLIESTPDAGLAAELSRTSSVLAALVNLTQTGSLYESLDARGRYENTLSALSALLRAESLQKPFILFLEDTHWLDEDSRAFLSHFVQTLLDEPEKNHPIAIIATQRPEGESPWKVDQIPALEIRLDKLSSESLSQLAADILSHPISDSLLALLEARADGNPFFAEQILRYLWEQGALTLDADGQYFANAQAETSLPTDVRSVMVARLDCLTLQVKEMVQTAAVLGREFEVRVLGEMLRSDQDFSNHIAQAENANIWIALNEIEYIFRHALLRDAAYSMQLLTRQRELHGLAVSAMEAVYRDDLESHYGELAYHAERAVLQEKALHYLTLAGKLVLGVYQNQRAIDYFTRALAFIPDGDLQARFDVLIERAEAYHRVSEFDAQSRDLDALEKLANELRLDELIGRVFSKRAHYFNSLGDYHNTILFAEKAKHHSEMAGDNATLLASYMLIQMALLHTGQIRKAMQQGRNAIKFAEHIHDRRGEAAAFTMMGLVAQENVGPASARLYHEKAFTILRDVKDNYLKAKVLNNLANTVVSLGDFSAAQDYYSQSLSIFQEHGDLSRKGLVLINMGWLAGVLGDYDAAMAYYEQGLPLLRRIGNRMEEMYACVNMSAIEIAREHSEEALLLLEKAFEISSNIGRRTGAAGWICFYSGYAHLIRGDFDLAAQSFLESIEIRTQIGAPVLAMEARSGLCETYLKSGDLTAATRESDLIAGYIEKNKTLEGMEEPLRVFLSVATVLGKVKDPRAQVVLQYAFQLLDAQVSKVNSIEARRMFVENVPWRREIRELAKEKGLLS